ncbi:hypothetical protein Malapachy_08004 [Malassezia pachydermatis]|uniref:Macrofage activating glycoprotein n=1 Tax=Malassezia pachydermatis TaxID=77020 RepID=A0A0M8MVK4_9BASI|nr:hypothetical protein Malapachy_08004 [Malassezia pachydermatis]KOS14650.1 hypothetical protein Malapachy_08004 [Malassezia pachydermatis]
MSVVAQYSATYVPGANSLPKISEQGQQGTNACGTQSSDSSMCQNLYINSATDFCLWAPPGPLSQGVGEAERYVVSYCTKAGRGTRLIPPGTLKSVHFVQTPHYVQVSGTGEFSSMHINNNGGGGELDPHGQDGMGNPIGGLVFSNAFGNGLVQVHEWNSFMDAKTYCLRACVDGDMAKAYCKNIYDELGCNFNMPTGPDNLGVFESCEGQDADIVGVYTNNGVVSTFFQTQTSQGVSVPPPKKPPAVSKCSNFPSAALEDTVKNPFAGAKKGKPSSTTSQGEPSSSSVLYNTQRNTTSSTSSRSTSSSTSSMLSSISSTSMPMAISSTSSSSAIATSRAVVTTTTTPSATSIPGLQFGSSASPSFYVHIFTLLVSATTVLVLLCL